MDEWPDEHWKPKHRVLTPSPLHVIDAIILVERLNREVQNA